jgi:predicted helicase
VHIDFYNKQVENGTFDTDPTKISWSYVLENSWNKILYELDKFVYRIYRPFGKQALYYGDKIINGRYQNEKFSPPPPTKTC